MQGIVKGISASKKTNAVPSTGNVIVSYNILTEACSSTILMNCTTIAVILHAPLFHKLRTETPNMPILQGKITNCYFKELKRLGHYRKKYINLQQEYVDK